MSRDSGVPTFRDALTGLWARFDPQELATEAAFRRHPARVFGWYMWRWKLVRAVTPHVGYDALVRLERRFDEFVTVTQNVDGLHSRAGSGTVVELHGSIAAFRCLDGGHPYPVERLESIVAAADGEVEPPGCPACGSPIRPGVVWFGEMLPHDALTQAYDAVAESDALLVIGTSALVYPAADLPLRALQLERPVVEINPDRTPLSDRASLWWPASAASALPHLAEQLHPEGRSP
jgi:NAD-dependent deacetylase